MANDISKKLSRALADIRSSFISSRDYSNLDNAIDSSISKLTVSDLNNDTLNYAENMKKMISQGIDGTSISKEVTTNILQSPEVIMRFGRYANAEEVVYNIPQCGRALNVLKSGILSPDNVTKASLNILLEEKNDSEELRDILNNVRVIKRELKIEEYLDNIVNETLKYGDKFIELCSYKSKEVPLTQSLYLEEKAILKLKNSKNEPVLEKPKSFQIVHEQHVQDNEGNITKRVVDSHEVYLNLVEDYFNFEIGSLTESKEQDRIYKNIEELRIIKHDPTKIIKLQSERFKVCLGYLVLPEGFGANQASGMGMVSANGLPASITGNTITSGLTSDVYLGIDNLYMDLVKMVKRHVNSTDIKVNKKEMKELLTRLVKDLDQETDRKEIKIRYVPPERMEHFMINEGINFPYGEGIFEKSMHAAKELIALKTAVTIRRITDAVDKRVIYVESKLPRNSRNMITLLRESLRKRKFSMNNLSNISTIPSMMTSFEDYIITSNNGKRHVEFDTIPASSSIRDITEELKFFRDELVSSLDVPPAFIGIEENINGKTTLAHESALFAETILSYQKIFNKHIFKLFNSIHKLLYGKVIPDNITISLPAPKMLYVSVEAEHLETVARIIEVAKTSLDISPETIKKRFLPLDWEEEEDAKTRDLLDKRGKPSDKTREYDDGLLGGGFTAPMMPPMDAGAGFVPPTNPLM